MRILIVYYSRSGYTAAVAEALVREMRRRGHSVVSERILVERNWNKWLLFLPLLPLLPFLPPYLMSGRFRRLWHKIYLQPEQAIRPPACADVSDYDLLLLGTPKWLYVSYPVARWLGMVHGLDGMKVASFATFCGPPMDVFEMEMLFEPLEARLHSLGAVPSGRLAISSDHHEYFFAGEMRGLFRWISSTRFGRPLGDFTLDGELGKAALQRFCDELSRGDGSLA